VSGTKCYILEFENAVGFETGQVTGGWLRWSQVLGDCYVADDEMMSGSFGLKTWGGSSAETGGAGRVLDCCVEFVVLNIVSSKTYLSAKCTWSENQEVLVS